MNNQTFEVNDPDQYIKLPDEIQMILQIWIKDYISPFKTKSFVSSTSYYLKHSFTEATGIYITNGQMKGSLLAAGFEPKDMNTINWVFRFSSKAGSIQ